MTKPLSSEERFNRIPLSDQEIADTMEHGKHDHELLLGIPHRFEDCRFCSADAMERKQPETNWALRDVVENLSRYSMLLLEAWDNQEAGRQAYYQSILQKWVGNAQIAFNKTQCGDPEKRLPENLPSQIPPVFKSENPRMLPTGYRLLIHDQIAYWVSPDLGCPSCHETGSQQIDQHILRCPCITRRFENYLK